MKVVFVASEVAPYSKSGGLADVAGALPRELAALGAEVTVIAPLYAHIDRTHLICRLQGLGVPLGGDQLHADVWEGRLGGARVLFLDPPGFFERPFLYGPPGGEYADNAFRFAFLARGALEVTRALGLSPDIFHANDWHTGLLPLLLRRQLGRSELARARTVFTVHNLGYQGLFPQEVIDVLGLGADLHRPEGIEFYGRASYLKAGLLFSDVLSTVSPTYAREIQTAEFGYGLDGVVRTRAAHLHGILNGIDSVAWDPARDPYLAAPFTIDNLSGKALCKAAVQRELDLEVAPRTPLFAVISRLAWQKGWDLFEPIADTWLTEEGAQLMVIGTGEPRFEAFFQHLGMRYPGQVATRIGFDESLAHRIEAGADLFLMPSRYEPCGLNQLYSLRYGTLPLVRATGGLEDTVVDAEEWPERGNGFKFRGYEPTALLAALRRAMGLYRSEEGWTALVRRAMAEDHSWGTAARQYLDLYERTLSGPGLVGA